CADRAGGRAGADAHDRQGEPAQGAGGCGRLRRDDPRRVRQPQGEPGHCAAVHGVRVHLDARTGAEADHCRYLGRWRRRGVPGLPRQFGEGVHRRALQGGREGPAVRLDRDRPAPVSCFRGQRGPRLRRHRQRLRPLLGVRLHQCSAALRPDERQRHRRIRSAYFYRRRWPRCPHR
ncbi:hypothetical protein LTR94_032019, partial [Friedmanniomyces endolithicus]